VLPSCNIAAMNLHPAEIAAAVSPGAHATVLLDQAGRHISNRLVLPLPARCPELNAAENLWQFRRDNWLSNRVFPSHEAIADHCCNAGNRLIDQPRRIMPIGLRDWVNGFRSVGVGIMGWYWQRPDTNTDNCCMRC